MKRAKQGTNPNKTDGRTAGSEVNQPAADGGSTQRSEPRRTPESRGDRDDHLGGSNQRQQRSGPAGRR